LANEIDGAFSKQFREKHGDRRAKYEAAIHEVEEKPEFSLLPEQEQEKLLTPMKKRATAFLELSPYLAVEKSTSTTLRSMEEDLVLLPTLQAGALSQLVPVVKPTEKPEEGVEVIRLSEFLPRVSSWDEMSDKNIDEALDRLKEKLYSLRELKRKAIWE
jgi:hypothetical protein